ncbi:mannose-specific lectin-like isoform X2 [Pygocentrus nattereri]|nr:mannose-specific lectin-like isoform X2 [Pygocentrus nattereri]XP_017541523.1 mannose-specific lectin-like isoform X2 [Pygocentrus nattereri]XP_017541524.1 mannose-specific lectin-like isoform X2 [Pygocentrus nattereri]XP_017541525.1 mannose-specific lectin-like isoform X2 [Pygocentrus nattereri]XP_037402183.1 mannose-specific lectin-like isoform X2 [Pygocentrus nattereri]
MSRNYISKYNELRKGDYLCSNNKEYKAVFQEDGNFVIYGWKPVWSSDTGVKDAHCLCMQDTCNLVMYRKDDKAVWHTNTLYLRNDSILVIEKDGEEVWNSALSRGQK